ncbi:MAG: hypothetical protein ACRD0S_04910 [Acidimicrobiales bacterium]
MTPAGSIVYVELLPDTDLPDDSVLVGSASRSGKCFWTRRIAGRGPRFATNNCLGTPAPGDFGSAW